MEDKASRDLRLEGGDQYGRYYFSEKKIQRDSLVLSILFRAVLLIGGIACLYQVSDRGKGLILGMIVFFTCLFAVVVGLLTNARRAEIFGSTAA